MFHIQNKIQIADNNNDISADSIKRSLFDLGPLTFQITPSGERGHCLVLSGYYIDPVDSVNVWIFKNSYGKDYGEDGFMYRKLESSQYHYIFAAEGPVITQDANNYNVECLDIDGDGYYNWGIGPKPDTCPECPDLPDCNDNDPYVGPYDSCFNCSCNYSFQGVL